MRKKPISLLATAVLLTAGCAMAEPPLHACLATCAAIPPQPPLPPPPAPPPSPK